MVHKKPIAFFDVDETLISIKSMFDFYDYFLAAVGHSAEEQHRLQAAARDLLRPGLPRVQGNRLFYQRFAGYKVDEVAGIGREWFAAHLDRGGLFHTDVLDALRAHTAAGTTTVLLSGSFPACLDPVREHAGADLAMSTQLEVRDGVYTGEVTRTMIGDAKATIASELIARAGVAAADCHAYGDHVSDLGLLRLVGHPVAVGTNAEVLAVAEEAGWARLPGTPG
ncbi:HAD family hydrolase [Amycolatopsis rhabdoformis]|uniref:HAD family hydrolase n=1 Tax=Amycolatopsis rhabdoformis TaxID=1448059 RepID=A0ABZ1I5U9_9PSEU|nr:HAD family hydrolase [Amycolatopsis rhabdoformis]WSE29660.1 HAD family hydrolase [Amycolatopsis rhabdoformis]